MPKPPPLARTELRDSPRCGVCHWRHDPPECKQDDAPVKFLGITLNGRPLWATGPSLPTRRGGRRIGHAVKEGD